MVNKHIQVKTCKRKYIKSNSFKREIPKRNISKVDIIRTMALPQKVAARLLNVSLSTLKRRYYELGWGRWPINSGNSEQANKFINTISLKKDKISDILNESEIENVTEIEPLTMKILKCAFEL